MKYTNVFCISANSCGNSHEVPSELFKLFLNTLKHVFLSFLKNDLTYSFTLSYGMKLDYIPFKINITGFDIVYSWIEIRFVCLRGNF